MATYDPSKRYTWTPGDQFVLSGEQFGIILNALRVVTSTQEAQRILLANDAAQAIEAVMANAVEAGVVKEVEETPQQANL
jgi:hypothetical protein